MDTVIAVAQLAVVIGEPGANAAAAAAAVAEAAAAGARLVVLPELCDSGYVFGTPTQPARAEARGLATPAAASPTLRGWREEAAKHELVIVGGFCELGDDGLLYNSAAVVDAHRHQGRSTARPTCGTPRSSSSRPATRRLRWWTPALAGSR